MTIRAARLYWALAFFALLLFGCAHVTTAAKTCAPTIADVATVWADAQSEGYVGALESLVATKGLCLVQAAVDQAIGQHTVAAETTLAAGAAPPPDGDYAAIARLQLWRAQHP